MTHAQALAHSPTIWRLLAGLGYAAAVWVAWDWRRDWAE